MNIKIQKKDFKIDEEVHSIKKKYSNIGAVSTFIGYVRNNNENKTVRSIELEVYKEMAVESLGSICKKAKKQ